MFLVVCSIVSSAAGPGDAESRHFGGERGQESNVPLCVCCLYLWQDMHSDIAFPCSTVVPFELGSKVARRLKLETRMQSMTRYSNSIIRSDDQEKKYDTTK
jgi:hypothetical protein